MSISGVRIGFPGHTHDLKEEFMKKEYGFSKGKRGAVLPQVGKTRITIYLDDAILKRFKAQSERTGKGYQTHINDALNSYIGLAEKPLTAEMVRKIVVKRFRVTTESEPFGCSGPVGVNLTQAPWSLQSLDRKALAWTPFLGQYRCICQPYRRNIGQRLSK